MRIKAIEVENFVGIKDGRYAIGTLTRVSGKNGAGKTSLGRALAYALTGMRPDGTMAADDYRSDTSKPMQVTIETDGPTLSRKRTKTPHTIFDSLPHTNDQLAKVWNMPMLAMLVQTWPGSWFSLTEAKQRELILSILPKPDYRAIFEKKSGIDGSEIDWSQSAASLHTAWSQKRLALEKEGAAIGGQIREIDLQIEAAKNSAGDPDALEKELADLQQELLEASAVEQKLTARKNEWDRYHTAKTYWQTSVETSQLGGSVSRKCETCGQMWTRIVEAKPPPPEPTPPIEIEPNQGEIYDAQKWRSELQQKIREVNPLLQIAVAARDASGLQARNEQLETVRLALREKYVTAKAIESALHLKTGIWADALREQLAHVSLPGYAIELGDDGLRIRIASTGVPVGAASSGERIKFCLALSHLIGELAQCPIRCTFIEHADLLDSVPRLPGFQLIGERVAKVGDFSVDIVVN
jgi:hypothetical protein